MKYGNRSIWKMVISSPLTLLAIFVVLGFLLRAGWNIHKKADLSSEKLSQAEAEMAKLDERKSTLTEKIGYLSTDQGIESEFRTKYRAVKEGESVAVILGEEQTASAIQASSTPETSFWRRLLNGVGL